MGRYTKKVQTQIGIDRRETGYYSTPAFISEFIANVMVELNPTGSLALDPCVGEGEMAIALLNRGIAVDGMDILSFDLPEKIFFQKQDFLEYYRQKKNLCILGQSIDLPYDFYIANPPYNCHEVAYIRENKSILTSLFSEIGVHNMYSMFISALIDCAKPGAILGFITLDSFLTAKAHTQLRQKILHQCQVHYLILCSNDLFLEQGADVRTCITILQKGNSDRATVKVANRPFCRQDLQRRLERQNFVKLPLESLTLSERDDNCEFIIDIPDEIRNLFNFPRLGQLFPCVTGISTGCDRKYLSKQKQPGFTIPFYKNPGSARFFTKPNAYLVDNFLEVDREVRNFMIRNKTLLYQPGITCSSMGVPFTACYLPPNSTYGVNANIITNEFDTWWLLAYLNSHLVTFIVRGILNRSNMITSGYVSRIPIPKLSDSIKNRMSAIAKEAYVKQVSAKDAVQYVDKINILLQEELNLSEASSDRLRYFCRNLLKAT